MPYRRRQPCALAVTLLTGASVVAGAMSLAVLCATTAPAQTGGQRRAGRDWWSLQPLRPVAVPSVDGAQRPINPIDHFILHRLKKERLAPSPAADRTPTRLPSDSPPSDPPHHG